MSGGQSLILLLSVLATAALTAALLFGDRIAQLLVGGLVLVLLLVGAHVAMPPDYHRMRAARYAVWVFGGILALVAGFPHYVDALVRAALVSVIPEAENWLIANPSAAPVGLVVVATVVMFFAFLRFLRAPLGYITRDPLIREASYRDRRAAFVASLKSHLDAVDEGLRWHHRDFVSLNAEVDVRNANRSRRRMADLVEAIKLNRDADIFLVVGMPGAGKSVALRKCSMDLLAVQQPTERIPLYVNLKEWSTRHQWTAETPPTNQDFEHFVRANVRNRLSDRSRAFFDEHFDRMVEAGEFFFMFDSFDEIPGVLDADETSKLLDAVSAVIVRYLRGHPHGRGVIASRYYRRPRLGQERHVQLDVRPFSERQIAEAVTQGASRSEALKKLLFKERPDLGALARNPFTLSLILLYWEHHLDPPPNQSALFAAYIDRSLEDATETMENLGLDSNIVREAMTDISWAMFESDRRGLELTVGELRTKLNRDNVDALIDVIVAARLARKAAVTQAVSFVHRRFNEYFLVSRWLSGVVAPPFEAIPTDGRYRDALVLYAEVAAEAEAAQLARFCWHEVAKVTGAINATLSEAMRAI